MVYRLSVQVIFKTARDGRNAREALFTVDECANRNADLISRHATTFTRVT